MAQQTYPTPSFGPTGQQYGPPAYPNGIPVTGFGPPAPRKRTGAIIGAVVAAVLVLGGLAVGALLLFGSTTLDTAEAESQISQLTEDQAGIAPTDVSCPADIAAEAGATFACSASLEDQPISFTVTQTDDEGNVRISSDNTFVDVATVEASLAEQLGEEAGVEAVSTCDTGGRTVLVDGIGTPISCTVTNAADASDSVEVIATVDESGAVSYEVA
jgi:Domain of unknown function (DUF4333)